MIFIVDTIASRGRRFNMGLPDAYEGTTNLVCVRRVGNEPRGQSPDVKATTDALVDERRALPSADEGGTA